MDNWLWVAAALSLALSFTPWGRLLLYPFKVFTTWVHECGHALMTVLLGGSVNSVTIQPDASGLTESLVPAGRLARGLVASAGYLSASAVGCLLVAATRVEQWARGILWAVGAFMLFTLIVWMRNLFGFVMVLAWGAALLMLARKGSGNVPRFVLSLLAIQVALDSVYDIRVLFQLDGGHSDAETMAGLFLLPSWLWASAWMLMSLGMLGWTLWITRVRSPRPLTTLLVFALAAVAAAQAPVQMPSPPLTFGVYAARFDADGTFTLEGPEWPAFKGTWKIEGARIELLTSGDAAGCAKPGRYTVGVENTHVSFDLVSDDCTPRRMILDRSSWRPPGEAAPVPERHIVRTGTTRARASGGGSAAGSWPSFRGPQASGIAEGQNLPDRWDGRTGDNILWRTPIPGLSHSSPIVWGDRIFVTTAVSSKPNATFRPGLYGDGDASDDRSRQRWMIYAIDRRTGTIQWERVAHEGEPVDKRHIKSTYASATPVTDGRIVVASFGSQGVHAYDVDGTFRWKVDLGRLNLGAYDIPTFEWGPASSPIIWNGLVILQCDNQSDSFLLALDADTGETVWKARRDELPSWGTPTVAATSAGPVLVTNASNFIRGYDPATGKELWRLGGSSKITAPTPVYSDDLFVVASGRAPERPLFVIRSAARGDLTLPDGKTSSDAVAWSRTGRGSYMPTPLIYRGLLYVVANNGVFDAYTLRTGEEVYRQRLAVVGSGFSASPVAADGKIYLSNEDGEILVVAAGPEFKHIATNSMGELLMATPALSAGVMYVRTSSSLFAIGQKR